MLIASAWAMPRSYPGELVLVPIPRNLTDSLNICSISQSAWGGIFYEHMHQNEAKGICADFALVL